MYVIKPSYYDSFRCLAGSCPDSCCKEWAVVVDPESAAMYRSLSGPLGERLRQVLTDEDGVTLMQIENGRCPMWRRDGLCQIQAELGEEALCHTCTQFPRLTHDYGDYMELGLELSCPEAARLILTAPVAPFLGEEIPGGEGDYDRDAMASLRHTRAIAIELVILGDYDIPTMLALLLLYGCQAQSELDVGICEPFDAEAAMETARSMGKSGDITEFLEFFKGLEILTDTWQDRLAHPDFTGWNELCRPLAKYFAERYWLQAVSDYDLYSRVKLAVVCCICVCLLGGDFMETAQLMSKEIENNADNVDALLDAAYTHSAFTDDKLLGMLSVSRFDMPSR